MNHLYYYFRYLLLGILMSWQANAAEVRIFEVRRNIPLSDSDPVYKDYYLTAGEGAGLKLNMVVQAIRDVTFKDPGNAKSSYSLRVSVGYLKVIHIQAELAVARLFEFKGREFLPMLEQSGILVGDKIDLKGAFIDTKNSKRPKDTSTAAFEQDEELDIDGVPLKEKRRLAALENPAPPVLATATPTTTPLATPTVVAPVPTIAPSAAEVALPATMTPPAPTPSRLQASAPETVVDSESEKTTGPTTAHAQ